MYPDLAIDVRELVKTFRIRAGGEVRAVSGVDLSVGAGEVVALLGPNGAGKTTTLDVILGLTRPTSGTATVYGRPPRVAVTAGRISAVLQSGGLLRDLSVRETVRMIASVFDGARPVDEVIARAGLIDQAARKVSKCSGGEQQRLRYAVALLPDPDLLVLDEPTAGMDVAARRAFWDTMHADANAGRTIVFATHYLEEADAFARRIVMMARGRIVADGTTADIRARATGRTVSADLPATELQRGAELLGVLPGVGDVTLHGRRVTVRSADPDLVARVLLTELCGTELEITSGSLEQAFLSITGLPREEVR